MIRALTSAARLSAAPALVDDHSAVRARDRVEDRLRRRAAAATRRSMTSASMPSAASVSAASSAVRERAAVRDDGDVACRPRGRPRARCRRRPRPRQLAVDVVERPMLEDQHRVRVLERGPRACRARPRASPGASTRRPGTCAYQPSRLCECCAASWRPAPVVMRITSGTQLPAGHVRQRRGVVDDLVEREQAEVDGHDLDDRPHPGERGADAGADERGLRQRRVADRARGRTRRAGRGSRRTSRRSGRRPRPSGTHAVVAQRVADRLAHAPRGRSVIGHGAPRRRRSA